VHQVLAADRNVPQDRLVIGSGDHLFEVVRPWGRLPDGMRFGNVSSIAVDGEDRVYAYQRSSPPLLVFNADGEFLHSWQDTRLMDAHGIGVGPDGRVYAVDRDAHEVVVLTPNGVVDMVVGRRAHPSLSAPFNHPADVSVAPDGEIYVADGYGNFRVHRFRADGGYLESWGKPGRAAGEFRVPHGIWASHDRVFVADRENGRVQIFSRDGQWLDEWDFFFRPTDIYLDPSGTVYVTDLVPSLSIIQGDGSLVARGRPAQNIAHGIWGDSTGSLYIAEGSREQITKLVRRPANGSKAQP
jgi:DNA-binding beta-propeller fold protein YncE